MSSLTHLIIIVLAIFYSTASIASARPSPEIKLVLQITVDGLRGDLLNRYQAGFGKDGFKYLLNKGTVYTNAHYQYANTDSQGIARAVSSSGLASQNGSPLLEQVRRNFHPSCSGDIYIVQEPYWFLFEKGPIATMHGSPWRYDTHVPSIFANPAIKAQRVHLLVHPIDVASTIAAFLGMTPPTSAQGSSLEEVLH
jgi:hypothetical protein